MFKFVRAGSKTGRAYFQTYKPALQIAPQHLLTNVCVPMYARLAAENFLRLLLFLLLAKSNYAAGHRRGLPFPLKSGSRQNIF